jgi:hypothetical protein
MAISPHWHQGCAAPNGKERSVVLLAYALLAG